MRQSRETEEGHEINCFVRNTNFIWTFPFCVGGQMKMRSKERLILREGQHSCLMGAVLEQGDFGTPGSCCHLARVPRCHPRHPQTR